LLGNYHFDLPSATFGNQDDPSEE